MFILFFSEVTILQGTLNGGCTKSLSLMTLNQKQIPYWKPVCLFFWLYSKLACLT